MATAASLASCSAQAPCRSAPASPLQRLRSACPQRAVANHRSRKLSVATRADSRSGDGAFLSGFLVGGVVFGALGFVFAPQISKALLGDDQRLRLPRFMEEEAKDPEATKQDLIDKIALLNASIDEVASQLKGKDTTSDVALEQEALVLNNN